MTALSSISVSINQPTLQELVDRVLARNQGLWATAKTAVLAKVDNLQSREGTSEALLTTSHLWHP